MRSQLSTLGTRIVDFLAAILLLFHLSNLFWPFEFQHHYSKVFLDSEGNIISATLSKDEKWRLKLNEEEINPLLISLLLAKEDSYFYYHPGVDVLAICRALFSNLTSNKKVSGASTITMQTVRLLEPRPRTYLSKIVECFRAFQLEAKLSKQEIIRLYLERIPYGGNVEGFKTACYLYFGVPTTKLTLSELLTLVIVPNQPNTLSLKKNKNEYLERNRKKWLKRLLDKKHISQSEFEASMKDNPLPIWKPFKKIIPHLSRKLIKESPFRTVYPTTIHSQVQEVVQIMLKDYVQRTKSLSIYNAAALVLENNGCKVRAYVGSQDFDDSEHAGQVDGVTAIRSPGSTLKPLLYALAIDKGYCTGSTMLLDVPMDFKGYAPENFDKKFRGKVSMSKALQMSLNVPAVQTLDDLGVAEFTELLVNSRCKTIEKMRKSLGLSLVLGGCGVSALELAGLYAMLANGGKWNKSIFLEEQESRVSKKDSNSLLTPSSCYIISDVLSNLNRPDLNEYAQFTHQSITVSWKTGTSYGRRDAWCVGYTPRYTVVVWLGNFDNSPSPELIGLDLAAPLFFQILQFVEKRSDRSWFKVPPELKTRSVCTESGLPPDESCTSFVNEYYIPGISPYLPCSHLKKHWVDEKESMSYCPSCLPKAGFKTVDYFNYPPLLLDFYKQQKQHLALPPSHNPQCKETLNSEGPLITQPKNGNTYFLERGEEQTLFQLSCLAPQQVNKVFWFVNGRLVSKNKPSEKPFVNLLLGHNRIECVDEFGNKSTVTVEVDILK